MFCLRVITVLPLLLISTSASFLRLPPQLPSYPTNLTLPIAPNRPPLTDLTKIINHRVPGTKLTVSFTIYLDRRPALDRLREFNCIDATRRDLLDHRRRGEKDVIIGPPGSLLHWESSDDRARLEIDSFGRLTWGMLGAVTQALLWLVETETRQFDFMVLTEGVFRLAGYGRMRPIGQ